MKIASWNVNGYRSVWGKGFLTWLEKEAPDVVCLQEIKTHAENLSEEQLHPLGYNSVWHSAQRPGYSGLAVFSRKPLKDVELGLSDPLIDAEGRVMVCDLGKFLLVNSYFPNSQRDHARLPYKLEFCNKLAQFLSKKVDSGKSIVLCGDMNIAHKEIDLKNPKQNVKNAGFLPEERAWMDSFLKKDFIDAFRNFNQEGGHYTWWSYRPTIRERNIGWRLDYFLTNVDFKERLKNMAHQPQTMGSDHCPIILEIKD